MLKVGQAAIYNTIGSRFKVKTNRTNAHHLFLWPKRHRVLKLARFVCLFVCFLRLADFALWPLIGSRLVWTSGLYVALCQNMLKIAKNELI